MTSEVQRLHIKGVIRQRERRQSPVSLTYDATGEHIPLVITLDQAARLISEVLRAPVVDDGASLRATPQTRSGVQTYVSARADVEKATERLASLAIEDQTILLDGAHYEVLLREESPLGYFRFGRRDLPFALSDPDSGVTYSVGPATNPYVLFCLAQMDALNVLRTFWRPFSRMVWGRAASEQGDLLASDSPTAATLFDALREMSPRLLTLQIETSSDRSPKELHGFADSFLFHLSFNLDTSLVPVRSFDELARRTRIRRVRRSRLEEMDPPRRIYRADLVHHYQMGVATDSAPLEFLSYYHVAESFFEDVFHDELLNSIRDTLTRPDFSYRRKADLRRLVALIQQRVRIREERVTFNEQEALRLTLGRYVDIAELGDGLQQIDAGLLDYYRTKKVAFSGGTTVDLAGDDLDSVMAQLSARLYTTRNAIVHSKEGSRPRYQPFRDDAVLVQEVPLVRLIAEQILLRSSEPLQ